jgi:hypothetical protein
VTQVRLARWLPTPFKLQHSHSRFSCFPIPSTVSVWHSRLDSRHLTSKFGELITFALKDAQANGYVVKYKDNAETKMGILHAVYGKPAVRLAR